MHDTFRLLYFDTIKHLNIAFTILSHETFRKFPTHRFHCFLHVLDHGDLSVRQDSPLLRSFLQRLDSSLTDCCAVSVRAASVCQVCLQLVRFSSSDSLVESRLTRVASNPQFIPTNHFDHFNSLLVHNQQSVAQGWS